MSIFADKFMFTLRHEQVMERYEDKNRTETNAKCISYAVHVSQLHGFVQSRV